MDGSDSTDSPFGQDVGALARSLGLAPAFRARQVFSWLARGCASFDAMTDLPARERERLSAGRPSTFTTSVDARLDAPDGAVKLGVRLRDGSRVECVLLVDRDDRVTACLSCQTGCAMGCAFCKTGTLRAGRDCSAGEIVEQFHHLRRLRGSVDNVVFMGMGEPLANLEAVRAAVAILASPDGLCFSPRRVTISTCGLVPGIRSLADAGPRARLAVSLVTANHALRAALMPVERAYPLPELKKALLYHREKIGDRVTLEIALLGGVNTGPGDAKDVAEFARGLDCQVNVIPWNPVPGLPFRSPSREEVASFSRELEGLGTRVTRRMRRGAGVDGACGQLGEASPTRGGTRSNDARGTGDPEPDGGQSPGGMLSDDINREFADGLEEP